MGVVSRHAPASRPRWIVPPRKLTLNPGRLKFPPEPIQLGSARLADTLPLEQLQHDLEGMGIESRLVFDASSPAAVRLRRKPGLPAEAYELTVTENAIHIAATTDAGAFYGMQTLRDVMEQFGPSVPCLKIADHPDFPRRGFYHDCSRGKVPTLETLKALVERLARWKVNELQLNIENVFYFPRHPAIGEGYSPFTAHDLLDLQQHARVHHIRLIPSLASFGHMERILALPDYRRLGERPGFQGYPGGTCLCPIDRKSIGLMRDLYDDFLPLFEAEDFNACCDETWELGQGRSKRRAAQIGKGRVYLDHVLKLRRLAESHGKRLNIWGDIVNEHPELLPDVPRDLVMLNWEYGADIASPTNRIRKSSRFVEANLPLVVCPGTNAWARHLPSLTASYRNIAAFAEEGRRCQALGLLNTDWGDCGHRNFLGASLPAIAFGAAQAWNGAAVDEAGFTRLFCARALGQSDTRLADWLEMWDGAVPDRLKGDLYHLLVETWDPHRPQFAHLAPESPVRNQWWDQPNRITEAASEPLEQLLASCGGQRFPGRRPRNLPEFELLALLELELAATMNLLACQRTLTGKRVRAGRSVRRPELRRLHSALAEMADAFRDVWLQRNRPSRLQDNLSLMRIVAAEANPASNVQWSRTEG